MHVSVRPSSDDTALYATYEYLATPSQDQISDEGPDDYTYDLGDLHLYKLPTNASGVYRPLTGANINASGFSLIMPADSLVKNDRNIGDVPITENQEIRIFKAPLDTWDPPFAKNMDALYFIDPNWAKIAGDGVSVSIDAPSNWSDGDIGSLFLLGGYISNWGNPDVVDSAAYIYFKDVNGTPNCVNNNDGSIGDEEEIHEGEFANCGKAVYDGGKIVTDPMPRFTWVGIKK
jgi:hypothetical protein